MFFIKVNTKKQNAKKEYKKIKAEYDATINDARRTIKLTKILKKQAKNTYKISSIQ